MQLPEELVRMVREFSKPILYPRDYKLALKRKRELRALSLKLSSLDIPRYPAQEMVMNSSKEWTLKKLSSPNGDKLVKVLRQFVKGTKDFNKCSKRHANMRKTPADYILSLSGEDRRQYWTVRREIWLDMTNTSADYDQFWDELKAVM